MGAIYDNRFDEDILINYNFRTVYDELELLEKKAIRVFERQKEISIFRLYMCMLMDSKEKTDFVVRHNNIFRSECRYHHSSDKPFYIYDNLNGCMCYGCNTKKTVLDIIDEFIVKYINKGKKIETRFGVEKEIAIEVADAFINGVKVKFDKDGGLIECIEPKGYEYVNDRYLIYCLLYEVFKNYNSPIIDKYFNKSSDITERDDIKISNYINIHGFNDIGKMAKRLCLSKEYIEYRLLGHYLDSKLDLEKLNTFADFYASKYPREIFPFKTDLEKREERKKIGTKYITFYETDENVALSNSINIGNLLRYIEADKFRNSDIKVKNLDINSDHNKITFSLQISNDSKIDFVIGTKMVNNIEHGVALSLIDKKQNKDIDLTSIFAVDYEILTCFPSNKEEQIIKLLESNGVGVLFTDNEFHAQINNPNMSYYIQDRSNDYDQKDIGWYRISNSYLNRCYNFVKYDSDIKDERIKEFILDLLHTEYVIDQNFGEILLKSLYPDVWMKLQEECDLKYTKPENSKEKKKIYVC